MRFTENETLTTNDLMNDYCEGKPSPETRKTLLQEIGEAKGQLHSSLSTFGYDTPVESVIFNKEEYPPEIQEQIVAIRNKAFDIAQANAPLIRRTFSSGLLNSGSTASISEADLVQNAMLDLMKAACNFDPEKGEFSTFATRIMKWNYQLRLGTESFNPQSASGEQRYRAMSMVRNELTQQRQEVPGLSEVALVVHLREMYKAYQESHPETESLDESIAAFQDTLRNQQNSIRRYYEPSYRRWGNYMQDPKYQFAHHSFSTVEQLVLYRKHLRALKESKKIDLIHVATHALTRELLNPRTIKEVQRLLYLWDIKNMESADDIRTIQLRDKADGLEEVEVPAIELVPNDEDPVEDIVYSREREKVVHDAIQALPQKERTIIEKRFGLHGEEEHTLEELTGEAGVKSREGVRRIETQTLRALREKWVLRKLID